MREEKNKGKTEDNQDVWWEEETKEKDEKLGEESRRERKYEQERYKEIKRELNKGANKRDKNELFLTQIGECYSIDGE